LNIFTVGVSVPDQVEGPTMIPTVELFCAETVAQDAAPDDPAAVSVKY